jgi:hypothetical protein
MKQLEGNAVECPEMGENVHYEERSVRPSEVSDDLVQSVDQKFVKGCTS